MGVIDVYLSASIKVTRRAKDGKDGVSVQSSDVVFAISESKTTAPTTGWITNFGGLTLAEGKYVWTCTKTTLTDGDSYYTGAYCLGECYDFAQVEELYALGSSATKSPDIDSSLGVNIWQSSYTPKKGMYLWTCVRVTYNSNTPPYYLNKKCVSYFPTDGTNGTKFTPKGTAYGHYTASSKMPKPSDDVLGLLYLVDKVDTLLTPINKPCVVWWRSLSAGSYILSYDVAEEGDAYNVGGTLWVHNGTVWKDFGSIQGPKGDDGEDALNIELSTDKILFSWDSKNKIYDVATKDITLIVKQGNNIINIDDYTINFQAVENFELGSNNKNIRTDGAADGYTYNISVYSAGIAMKKYTFNASVNDKKQTVNYPASSCSVKMLITYNGITYTKIIAIEVSFVQMYGDTAWNTEQLSSTYGKLTAGYNGTLAQMESKISQNAENITLKVSQTYYDANNKKVDERFSLIEENVDNIKLQVSATSDGLKATGIDIANRSINMRADNFTLRNNKNEKTFGVDEFGNSFFRGNINNIKTKLDRNLSPTYNIETLGSWIEVTAMTEDQYIKFPWVSSVLDNKYYKEEELEKARKLVGSQVIIYNKENHNIALLGSFVTEKDYMRYFTQDYYSFNQESWLYLEPGYMAILECKLMMIKQTTADYSEYYSEAILWIYKKGKYHVASS